MVSLQMICNEFLFHKFNFHTRHEEICQVKMFNTNLLKKKSFYFKLIICFEKSQKSYFYVSSPCSMAFFYKFGLNILIIVISPRLLTTQLSQNSSYNPESISTYMRILDLNLNKTISIENCGLVRKEPPPSPAMPSFMRIGFVKKTDKIPAYRKSGRIY